MDATAQRKWGFTMDNTVGLSTCLQEKDHAGGASLLDFSVCRVGKTFDHFY